MTLPKLRAAAENCKGCELYKLGTQTVFGEGPKTATLFVIGEQPGDAEDRAGRPFVGPSGMLFDRALEAAGIDRDDVYVTNAVKHFKWARDQKSTRRLHRTPNAAEIRACMPWLTAELEVIKPRAMLCLGATAAKAILGRTFSVTKHRAVPVDSKWAPLAFATVHPSAVLRAPTEERAAEERRFFRDIERIARYLR
jgi:DNA polymerase